MNQSKEHARHVARIEQQLQTTATKVWTKPEFPAAHRPNIDRLSSHIRIGTNFSPLPLHPAMKPEHLARGHEQRMRHLAESTAVKVTNYDFMTRDISFGTDIVGLPDIQLRRFVYHQAGIDTLNKESPIPHNQYTDTQKERVTFILNHAFDSKSNIAIDRTHIVKPGFRELVFTDGYYLAEIGPLESPLMDQLYPTAFEIITDQIMRRGGDITSFDAAASSGQLQLMSEDTHPQFTQMLFEVLKFVNWRDLLDALKIGYIEQTAAHLDEKAIEPDLGAGIFIELFNAMKADEQNIATLAQAAMRTISESN